LHINSGIFELKSWHEIRNMRRCEAVKTCSMQYTTSVSKSGNNSFIAFVCQLCPIIAIIHKSPRKYTQYFAFSCKRYLSLIQFLLTVQFQLTQMTTQKLLNRDGCYAKSTAGSRVRLAEKNLGNTASNFPILVYTRDKSKKCVLSRISGS